MAAGAGSKAENFCPLAEGKRRGSSKREGSCDQRPFDSFGEESRRTWKETPEASQAGHAMTKNRKIAVVTTNRADYGLLSNLIRAIHRDKQTTLQLVVSGAHLSKTFGYTIREILKDRLPIAAKIKTDRVDAYVRVFRRLKPNAMIVLGDRYEILTPCLAAIALRIPIAHIHGGEVTEGVLDEQVRHAVTKMAHLHFAATREYRRNILQMGEKPENVFHLGAPGLENLKRIPRISRSALERKIRFALRPRTVLVTLHPETLTGSSLAPARALLAALKTLKLRAVFTASNPDAGGRAISKLFRDFARRHPETAVFIPSLGHETYIQLAAQVDAVVGNSSSGLIEIPLLKTPTVNIGDRQKGRLAPSSVLTCAPTTAAIVSALKRALSPSFRKKCTGHSPYATKDFSRKALDILKKKVGDPRLLHKTFRRIKVG